MFYEVMCFVTRVLVVKRVSCDERLYKIDGIIVCMRILWSEGLKQIPKRFKKIFSVFFKICRPTGNLFQSFDYLA